MNLSVKEKQDLLSINDLKDRALETLRFMNLELQKLELKNDIQSKVRFDLDQQQREYFLHQQMKTIQEELGGVSNEQEIRATYNAEITVNTFKAQAIQILTPGVTTCSIRLQGPLNIRFDKDVQDFTIKYIEYIDATI
jgi:ATP-dependent Lon protease